MAVELALVGDEAAPDAIGQVAAVEALGWRAIELRSVDGIPLAQVTERAFDALAARVHAAGLRVVAVASGIGGWGRTAKTPLDDDLVELEILARRMHALGAPYVRIMSFGSGGLPLREWRFEVLRRTAALAARAAELQVTLVHENCLGWAGRGPNESLELVRTIDDPALRLLFDTGNGLAYGYHAPAFLRRVLHWVAHVHIKDGVHDGDQVRYVEPGTGAAGVAECLRVLADGGYTGAISLEPHVAVAPHDGRFRARSAEPAIAAGRALERLVAEELTWTVR